MAHHERVRCSHCGETRRTDAWCASPKCAERVALLQEEERKERHAELLNRSVVQRVHETIREAQLAERRIKALFWGPRGRRV